MVDTETITSKFNVEFPLTDAKKKLSEVDETLLLRKLRRYDIPHVQVASYANNSFENHIHTTFASKYWNQITNPKESYAGKQRHVNFIKRRVYWSAMETIQKGLSYVGLDQNLYMQFYLDVQGQVDRIMKNVTIKIIKVIWEDFFDDSLIEEILNKPESRLTLNEIDCKIKYLTRNNQWDEPQEVEQTQPEPTRRRERVTDVRFLEAVVRLMRNYELGIGL